MNAAYRTSATCLRPTLARPPQVSAHAKSGKQSRTTLHYWQSMHTRSTTTFASSAPLVATQQAATAARQSRTLWQRYCKELEENPWRTKVVLAALIFASSDLATQHFTVLGGSNISSSSSSDNDNIDSERRRYDYSRAVAGAGFGVVATSFMHVWWGVLERSVNARVSNKLANTLTKVVLDQSIGAPTYLFMYYTITNFCHVVQKDNATVVSSWNMATSKASDLLLPTLTKHWRLWPAVHSLNFYYVPLQHRILVQNTVLVGWSGYLSYLNHQPKPLVEAETLPNNATARDHSRDSGNSNSNSNKEQQVDTVQQVSMIARRTSQRVLSTDEVAKM